jgi:hypothetical protein
MHMAEMRDNDETALAVRSEVQEAGVLAYEMARSYKRYVDYYRAAYGVSVAEADAAGQSLMAPHEGFYDEDARHGPPEDASWHELEYLTENDPEAAADRWLQIKQAARDYLATGHGPAIVMEGYNSHPWQRAQFLAIRAAFIEEWRPAGGIERALIDTMAQAHTAYQHWMNTLATYTSLDFERRKGQYDKDGYMEPPRISTDVAIQEAAGMADRFNRLFLRTLRQLRDLRRYAPAVTIESAGQVNIGGQQVNVAKLDEG